MAKQIPKQIRVAESLAKHLQNNLDVPFEGLSVCMEDGNILTGFEFVNGKLIVNMTVNDKAKVLKLVPESWENDHAGS